MYAQLENTKNKTKRVILVGGEEVGITPAVLLKYPDLFVDISQRGDFPGMDMSVWYDTENDLFTTTGPVELEEPKETIPEPTQLDRIESTLELLTADIVTAESISAAISEGVNEV